VWVTNRLANLQRRASVTITGTLLTTAMNMLEMHAGILPIQLLMHKACHWAALRIVLLSGSHPLHSEFCLWEKRYIKMHRSPLHELAHIYKV